MIHNIYDVPHYDQITIDNFQYFAFISKMSDSKEYSTHWSVSVLDAKFWTALRPLWLHTFDCTKDLVCLSSLSMEKQAMFQTKYCNWNYVNLTTPPPHSTPLSTSFLISQRVQQMYFDWLCLFDWLCILIDCVFSFFYMENNAEGLVVHFVLFFCLIITMKMKQLSHSSSYSKLLL